MPPPIPLSGAAAWYWAGSQSGSARSSANRGLSDSQACSGDKAAAIVARTSATNPRTTSVPRTNSSSIAAHSERSRWERDCAPLPPKLAPYLFFLTVKMPVPLVWVAIAVWSQVELLFAVASQPLEFGAPAWYWSSL
jgi:hypothetical protein